MSEKAGSRKAAGFSNTYRQRRFGSAKQAICINIQNRSAGRETEKPGRVQNRHNG
jgi:hypothetical protein